jgi:riboflavin kinase/FMN adenylyltransferase
MQIIRNLNQIKISLPDLALTIGNFDGVHLGHLQILSEVKKIAKEKKLSSAILTFEPHPIAFLKADKPRDFRIGGLAQKLRIFKEQQIDFVIILPFNQKFSAISADDFIEEILVQTLNVKHLTIGYDFIFGKNRQGNFQLLEEKSEKFGFALSEISAVKIDDQTCSSSLIRKLLADGKISEANKFLGRNFTIAGIVNNGRKLASQLGFPTANLAVKSHMMKLKFGVYKSETFIPHLGKKFSSITNFGIKPTINGNSTPLFETHILNFSENLYGKKIFVEFVDFIRDEKKFASIEELKKQIAFDVSIIGLLTNKHVLV